MFQRASTWGCVPVFSFLSVRGFVAALIAATSPSVTVACPLIYSCMFQRSYNCHARAYGLGLCEFLLPNSNAIANACTLLQLECARIASHQYPN